MLSLIKENKLAGLLKMIDGYKSYIILIFIAILMALNQGSTENLNINELMTDPDLLMKELFVALAAAGRSALNKIGN